MRLGLDAMGGDFAPLEAVKGAIQYSAENPDHHISLFGDQIAIEQVFTELNADSSAYTIVHCSEQIGMSEHGARAVATKKNSSINVGTSYVKEGAIDCFIGSGNTGAMLVSSIFILKPIVGINRPTITSILPRSEGPNGLILDVGANADCKPESLRQFALLGSVYTKIISGIDNPKVALLNIGEEKEKGNQLTQEAFKLLEQDKSLNFVGNIEGRDIFTTGAADVVVCDGFTGNIVLKTSEGLFYKLAKSGITSDFLNKFNFKNYGGAPILGVNGNIIIGHGISKADTFCQMLKQGANLAQSKLVEKIKSAL
jgi:glycerol-3-phosphate acyltransferase PlsX